MLELQVQKLFNFFNLVFIAHAQNIIYTQLFAGKSTNQFGIETNWIITLIIYVQTILLQQYIIHYSCVPIESWSVGEEVPSDIYCLYCIHAGFYIHSIYATFYMDPWRHDSIAMIIHHVLTVFLLCFSFAVR